MQWPSCLLRLLTSRLRIGPRLELQLSVAKSCLKQLQADQAAHNSNWAQFMLCSRHEDVIRSGSFPR